MYNLQNAIDGKMKQAQDWLVDPEALVGSAGQLDQCSKCYRLLSYMYLENLW